MKTLAKIIGAVLLLLVAVAVIAPFLIPKDALFAEVTGQVEATTGRTLAIRGEKSLSIFPSLTLELNDVHFSNMQGGSRPDMASMKQLAIHIPWLSLLSGDFKLEKFVISEPDVLLETDGNGNPNWQFFAGDSQSAEAKQGGLVKSPDSVDVQLGEVAVYGGRFTYRDGQTGALQEISDLELSILLPSLRKPLEVKGGVTYMAERFMLDAVVDNPAKAIEGNPFRVSAELKSALADLKFNGQVSEGGQDIKGSLQLTGDSVKKIAKWQGVELAAKDEAFNDFSVRGNLALSGNTFSLSDFSARLDKLDIKGKSTVTLAPRLAVKGDLDLGMLDLNPYLPEAAPAPQETKADEPAQPVVWDDTPMDLSAIKALDANLFVRSTGLLARDVRLGENRLRLELQNGRAKMGLEEFNAYEGKGQGEVVVDARSRPYGISTRFDLEGIDAEPLLSDAVKFDKLMGKGALNWQLSTKGLSQKDFVSALAGSAAFNFADGAVKGANIAEMVRKAKEMLKGNLGAVSEGLNSGFDEAEKTDFSALSGSFKFTAGVGTNTDLKMLSPLIRISGEGKVDLPATQVDYRLVTGIVDSIEGQGTQDSSTGFKIPVRIKGPFHAVKTSIDLKDAAKDEMKEKAKDKLKDKLKGLFGG